ncbi:MULTISPECIES: hypothetical protein [Sphingobacterium]|uniref:Tetratricopeptide repeat protein n=1 Tax=Sphingobacterium hotanense TaxID=649196 RepID=A0ABT7NRQ2_9SPHI|nr:MULTISPECIES: hypothetical protein [Sphingobacterium]MDM1049917.1 hypothetical protein [Sphingobacterium hotanense]
MSTNQLYIFSKNTDATATEQGYYYQKLKTLKTWLQNRINNISEVIYCDYEDDILQRNFVEGTSKFRQIKLYSSTFSFSTEEIKKSLANFFMLFTKGDYLFDDACFVFETNSSIAREMRGNDANLLKEWFENQDDMSEDLIARCKARVKEIIDEYVKDGYARQMAGDITGDFLNAKIFYDNLPEEFWEKFITSIKWHFENVEQQEAIPELRKEIDSLILLLPLPINSKEVSTYAGVLLHEITEKTIDPVKDNRILTNDLLDFIVLNQGTQQDKWYAEVYAKWVQVELIDDFRLGEFYEMIDATRHCRWNLHDSEHSETWLKLLRMYINLPETIIICKRKAIYEYLFLKMSTNMDSPRPTGSIDGEEEIVKFYFENFNERNSLFDLEDDITLLQIILAQWMATPNFLSKDIIIGWQEMVEKYIDECLVNPIDADEKCLLLELKGSCIFHFNIGIDKAKKVDEALNIYREIIPILPETRLYTISRLSDILGQVITVFIRFSINQDIVIDAIEQFLSEISEHADQTGKQHNAAHNLIERGVVYLKAEGYKNFGRALNCFHKASGLWLLNDTKDGYLLSVINIGQIYNALGANLAGKYYGLCGIWASLNFGDAKYLKRVADSNAVIYHADFVQGSWMCALNDFLNFLNAHHHFVAESSTSSDRDRLTKSFLDLNLILETAEFLHPELIHFINFYKQCLGSFYSEEMNYLVTHMKTVIAKQQNIMDFINLKTNDMPFNDVGQFRIIRFKILGGEWRLLFDNTFHLNAIAEEFGALLQITLCEIALFNSDLNFPANPILINIEQTDVPFSKIKQTDNSVLKWQIGIQLLGEGNVQKTKMHYASLANNIKYLISKVVGLDDDQINSLYDILHEKQKLGDKALKSIGYQYAYLTSYRQEDFDASQRRHFRQIDGRFDRELEDRLVPVQTS